MFPQANRNEICQRCTSVFNQKLKEVQFSIEKDASNTLYFVTNDKKWFNQVFKNSGDGIAIDVVSKERYGCDEILLDVDQIRGELLKPVYATALRKTLKPYTQNRFRTRVGKLSEKYKGKELEFNMLFLQDKNLCRYQTIFNLQAYQWGLLDMGLYLDSLTYKTKVNIKNNEDRYTLKYKTLQFTIPFEKNKSTYSKEDIKPLYDSLRLTDFNIKKIAIKAYSSVEGNASHNIELQNQRAKSIVDALQAFQTPTITTEVSASENWVEFLNAIEKTPYAELKDLNKSETKQKLREGLSNKLEPYLQKHRKAVINLTLEKKDHYKDKNVDALIELFNTTLSANKFDKAISVQNSIFERLKTGQSSPDILNKMVIPKQQKYVPFFNKNSVFRYLMDERNLLIAYRELGALEKLDPKNGKLKYNLATLKFKIWRYQVEPLDTDVFRKEILTLKKYAIAPHLISRMMVNFHIIKSEFAQRKRDYKTKDVSVIYIYENYKNASLSDDDFLSLAQYLSYYSNIDQAEEVLQDRVKTISVNENLLFYYLNLTLIDKELTQTQDYRTIMLNALNLDQKRFCGIFNAANNDGVTFQLLEDDYLRETYCENCNP